MAIQDGFTATLSGGRELRRRLNRVDAVFRGKLLEAAAIAGALPIQNQAKRNAHKVTGTMARSIHIGGHTELAVDFRSGEGYGDIGGAVVTRDHVELQIGTDVEYGRREELGFVGADSLGRRYSFTGHPYLRPAFDERESEAIEEVGKALADALSRIVL